VYRRQRQDWYQLKLISTYQPSYKRSALAPYKEVDWIKILVLTFKCVHHLAPAYLTELLHNRTNKGTRVDNKNLLVVQKVNKSTLGGQSFSFTAPFLWNQLPTQVEILLRSCKILQESCKILNKIKILIRSCLTVKILKELCENLILRGSYDILSEKISVQHSKILIKIL